MTVASTAAMPAVATTKLVNDTASGAPTTFATPAFSAPCTGSTPPHSAAAATQATLIRRGAAPAGRWPRTIITMPTATPAALNQVNGPGTRCVTPSQPAPSSSSDVNAWPAMNSPMVVTAPMRGMKTIPATT